MSAVWRKIGDIADVKGGKRLPKGHDLTDEVTEHPYLRVVDFDENGLDPSNVRYLNAETHEKISRYTISSNDIYISIAGTIGKVGIIPEKFNGANLTENAAKITNINRSYLPEYLLYYLRSYHGQSSIKNKSGGTSQPKLALYRIEEIEFPDQPKEVQQAIIDKVRPFDDMIQNNRRRIVLLEDTARLLYREMFVHFRLHELQNANCTDKLPDGWNKISIGEHCPFKYGKALKAESRVAGKYPVVGSSGIIDWHQEALVKGPGIVIGRKGNVGTVFFIQDDFWPIDTTYYITGPIVSEYLFLALNHTQFLNTDVAVPGLNRDFAHSREIILPQRNYLKKFQNHASPIFRKIKILNEHSTNLIRARDLLLPRLMDGRIAV